MGNMGDGHVAVHRQRRRYAAIGAPGQFLAKNHGGERTQPAAAILDRMTHAEESKRTQPGESGARDLAILLPPVSLGDDLVLDIAPQLAADHAQVVVEQRRWFHQVELVHGVTPLFTVV